jgi:hypothetical protein
MADGEVEVSVQAEGVDEAAGEMAPDAAGVGGPGGAGGGGGRGRIGGKLITRLLGVLAFLGPILDVIGVVANVLTAFVAPVAVLLLRLLQPVLRLMLRVLPVWFDIFEMITDVATRIRDLQVAFVRNLVQQARDIIGWIRSIPGEIESFITSLPGDIASAISSQIPFLGGGGGGDDSDGGDGPIPDSGPFAPPDDPTDRRPGEGPLVEIGGGLRPFIDRITQSASFDFP